MFREEAASASEENRRTQRTQCSEKFPTVATAPNNLLNPLKKCQNDDNNNDDNDKK